MKFKKGDLVLFSYDHVSVDGDDCELGKVFLVLSDYSCLVKYYNENGNLRRVPEKTSASLLRFTNKSDEIARKKEMEEE